MKKYLTGILSTIMVLCMLTGNAFAFTATEIDTEQAFDHETLRQEYVSDWAKDPVDQAISLGFVPEQLQRNYGTSITRAEFCALAVRFYETVTGAAVEGRSPFQDTDDVNMEKAAYLGIVSGVGNGRFLPDAELNREQAAKLLSSLAGVLGDELPRTGAAFEDLEEISDWAREAVEQVRAAGIMGGVGEGRFAPQLKYTREQSIATIMRLYERIK